MQIRKTHAAMALSFIGIVSAVSAQSNTEEAGDAVRDRGEAAFNYWCATCHDAGPGMPGTQALQAKYNGAVPAVLTEREDLTQELVAFYVRNGISVMPFFRKTEVSDSDLEAIGQYLVD